MLVEAQVTVQYSEKAVVSLGLSKHSLLWDYVCVADGILRPPDALSNSHPKG